MTFCNLADRNLSSLIKSGTDFRDLSEAILELKEQPEGSIRRRTIVGLTGKAKFAILWSVVNDLLHLVSRKAPRDHSSHSDFGRHRQSHSVIALESQLNPHQSRLLHTHSIRRPERESPNRRNGNRQLGSGYFAACVR